MSTPPSLLFDFARAREAEDPFAFRFGSQTYLLRTGRGVVRQIEVPWDTAMLDALRALQRPGADPAVVQALGDRLRGFVAPAAGAALERAVADAAASGTEVQLTIRSAAAELYALPWELMTAEATGLHLGEIGAVTIRYEWPGTRTVPAGSGGSSHAGRVLLAWSAAGGEVPARAHHDAIEVACRVAGLRFVAEQDVLAHATLGALSRALEHAAGSSGGAIAVLHLLAHGGAEGEVAGLVFDSGDGVRPALVDAGDLRRVLSPHAAQLRLVVLCACRSGDTGALGNHLGSLAQALHRAGIRAVVASRMPLSVDGSTRLTETLYAELLGRPSSLETALREARARLATSPGELDWASIQLHARSEDGTDTRPVTFAAGTGNSLMTISLYHASVGGPPWICRPIRPDRGIFLSRSV